MLKIKDTLNKELAKQLGFRTNYCSYTGEPIEYIFDNGGYTVGDNKDLIIIDIKNKILSLKQFNGLYKLTDEYKQLDKLYDLIKADLVEKVD